MDWAAADACVVDRPTSFVCARAVRADNMLVPGAGLPPGSLSASLALPNVTTMYNQRNRDKDPAGLGALRDGHQPGSE
jgi:hypothetical protein